MRTKFNVDKNKTDRTYEGIVFDSKLEMRFYRDVVCPKIKNGEITDYELQKPYLLQDKFYHNGKTIRAIVYTADFWLRYADGHEEVIDTKGFADSTALLKRKLFWFKYPDINYKWICYSKTDGGWCDYDYVKKQGSLRKVKNKKGEKNGL